MAVAIVQSNKVSNAGTATLITPSLTPSAIGDVFYVFAGHVGSSSLIPTITDTNNNKYTFLGFNNFSNSNVAVFACVLNSTTAMTVSAAFGSSVACDIVWVEASGLGSGGLGPEAVTGGSGTSLSLPTVTAGSGDLVFCSVYDQSHASAFTFPGAWTPLQTTANTSSSLTVAYQITSGSGSVGGGNVAVPSSSSGLCSYLQDFYFAVGSARVSQVVPEGVLGMNPHARVSQVVTEAVLNPNAHAFITQIVTEIIMPYTPPVPKDARTYVAVT